MDLNGNIDTNFGLMSGHFSYDSSDKNDQSYSFIIDDNFIYLIHNRIDNVNNTAIAILKLSINGNLISQSNEIWETGFRARDIAIDSNKDIYVSGYKCRDNDADGLCDDSSPKYDFSVKKFKSDLSQDNSFGNYSIKSINLTQESYSYSIAVQPDNKILLGGYVMTSGSNWDFALVRLNPISGDLDSTFAPNTNNIFKKDFYGGEDACYVIKQLPDGKILMGGFSTNSNNSKNLTIIRIK